MNLIELRLLIIQVVDALATVGERKGVDYRLNTSVTRIESTKYGSGRTRATGVLLDSGEVIEADRVICNADLIYSYNNLLPPTSYATSLSKRKASCSSISFYWALDRQFLELSAHNIFLAQDYKESFDSIFKKHQIPEEPSFYVNVPSRVDPSAAPKGCDSVVVLVPVGHLLDSFSQTHKGTPNSSEATQEWDVMVETARRTILRTIENRLKISLGRHIVHESVNTPPSWRDAFNLDRGAILGLSHSFFNVLSFRPKTFHPDIDDLYFVGASTHPGTGVPIVLAGAKIVSEQVLHDAPGSKVPWVGNGAAIAKTGDSPLDRVQWMPMLDWFHWAMLLLFAAVAWSYGAVAGVWDWRQAQFGGDW